MTHRDNTDSKGEPLLSSGTKWPKPPSLVAGSTRRVWRFERRRNSWAKWLLKIWRKLSWMTLPAIYSISSTS
ncbi:hypothetical protein ACROYT_G000736 [Oculina patagonica]